MTYSSPIHIPLFALAFVALASCASAQTAIERRVLPDASLAFPALAAHDDGSVQTIDHGAWDEFLGRYVSTDKNGVNRVDYGAVSDADRTRLDAYVRNLEATRVTALSSDEQLAFWINLYNARTVQLILENYPIGSIRAIKSNPFDFDGPWDNADVTVSGQTLTLNDIEHKIIRPIFDEPRIHYAVNCAAVGCPNLRKQAYVAATLDETLETAAREYINNARGVRLDDDKLIASKIFAWYREDFGESEEDLITHIRKFAEPSLAQALQGRKKINRYEYDWALNDARNAE